MITWPVALSQVIPSQEQQFVSGFQEANLGLGSERDSFMNTKGQSSGHLDIGGVLLHETMMRKSRRKSRRGGGILC